MSNLKTSYQSIGALSGNTSTISTPFSPSNIASLAFWIDATDPNNNGTQPADGSAVSSWVDKSGLGNSVIQGTGANQPIYKKNILNGNPVVRFDGVNDNLAKTSATNLGPNATVFVVGTTNGNASAGFGTFFDYSRNTTTNTGVNIVQNGTPKIAAGFFDGALNQILGSTITLPYTAIMSAYNDSFNCFLFQNGTQTGTLPCANLPLIDNVYTIGSLFNSVANWFLDGDVAEVIFYAAQLSAPQQRQVLIYLATKWNIVVS